MATSSEQLILRGLHILMRASFSPNEPAKQATHFAALQRDIGPWFIDYAEEIAKPAADALPPVSDELGGAGGLQQ